MMLTRHHALGAAIGVLLALLFCLLANGITAGAAAVASGEVVIR